MPTAALPDLLTVLPWPDPVTDVEGHDPRSAYVEDYWLGILGPSGTWIMRRFASAFDHDTDGFLLHPADLASEIGLGRGIGANAPFTRTLDRLDLFGLVRRDGEQIHVRRRVPELSRRQIAKLPEHVGRSHEYLRRVHADAHHRADQQQRARRLAATLAELGESVGSIEHRLHGWRIAPDTARDAATWAAARLAHPSAMVTTTEPTPASAPNSVWGPDAA